MLILGLICIAEALLLMFTGYAVYDLKQELDEARKDTMAAKASEYILRRKLENLREEYKEQQEAFAVKDKVLNYIAEEERRNAEWSSTNAICAGRR